MSEIDINSQSRHGVSCDVCIKIIDDPEIVAKDDLWEESSTISFINSNLILEAMEYIKSNELYIDRLSHQIVQSAERDRMKLLKATIRLFENVSMNNSLLHCFIHEDDDIYYNILSYNTSLCPSISVSRHILDMLYAILEHCSGLVGIYMFGCNPLTQTRYMLCRGDKGANGMMQAPCSTIIGSDWMFCFKGFNGPLYMADIMRQISMLIIQSFIYKDIYICESIHNTTQSRTMPFRAYKSSKLGYESRSVPLSPYCVFQIFPNYAMEMNLVPVILYSQKNKRTLVELFHCPISPNIYRIMYMCDVTHNTTQETITNIYHEIQRLQNIPIETERYRIEVDMELINSFGRSPITTCSTSSSSATFDFLFDRENHSVSSWVGDDDEIDSDLSNQMLVSTLDSPRVIQSESILETPVETILETPQLDSECWFMDDETIYKMMESPCKRKREDN